MVSGLFNAVESNGSYDRTYDSEFFRQLLGQLCFQGVPSDAFTVTASGGLNLNVDAGCGIIGGIFFYDKSSTNLTCTAASGTRNDLVVARLNEADRAVSLTVIQEDAIGAYDVALARVTVSGNGITAVQDLRSYYSWGAVTPSTITYGTAPPSGGKDGDIYFQIEG